MILPRRISKRISRHRLSAVIVWLAVASSCIVFSEPAPVDALLMLAIVALPILGTIRLGPISTIVTALWLVTVGLSFLTLPMSPDFGGGLKHLVITLYLVIAAVMLAGFIAQKPETRGRLFLNAYGIACLFASALALIGFFKLAPGAYELFTNFGRARGPFKDPNVLGAALAPGFIWFAWQALTAPATRALAFSAAAAVVGVALLLSFSRGAWLSVAVSLLVMSPFLLGWCRTFTRQLRIAGALAAFVGMAVIGGAYVLQSDSVRELAFMRLSLDQSYDQGPEGRFGGQQKAAALILQ
ncbi:MAG: hypothetical protein AAGJ53_07520, partial [Pseudomonadota bacterium]